MFSRVSFSFFRSCLKYCEIKDNAAQTEEFYLEMYFLLLGESIFVNNFEWENLFMENYGNNLKIIAHLKFQL
jgi:hypothetical protein